MIIRISRKTEMSEDMQSKGGSRSRLPSRTVVQGAEIESECIEEAFPGAVSLLYFFGRLEIEVRALNMGDAA